MGFGSNARIIAILAAIAPVVVGVYQQGEEARQRQAQRRAEQRQAVERKVAADNDADAKAAGSLEARLADEKGFCPALFFSASQLQWQNITARTRGVVNAALQLREPKDGSLTVCKCSPEALRALEQLIPPDMSDSVDRVSRQLRSAIEECSRPVVAAMSGPDVLRLQEQLAAVQAERDELRSRLSETNQRSGTQSQPSRLPASMSACAVEAPGETRRLRVFIQIPQPSASDAAEQLRGALNAQPPFKSPGIEVVGEKRSPRSLEVRYTYPVDSSAAEKVKGAAEKCLGVSAKLVFMEHLQGRSDTGVIEVWWPRSAQ